MDQLKVKDRILENISLSVKKVSAVRLVSPHKYCHGIYFSHAWITVARIGHLLSAKEGNFQVGGTLPARRHGRALPLRIETLPYNLTVHLMFYSCSFRLSCSSFCFCPWWTIVAPTPPTHPRFLTAACVVNTPATTPLAHSCNIRVIQYIFVPNYHCSYEICKGFLVKPCMLLWKYLPNDSSASSSSSPSSPCMLVCSLSTNVHFSFSVAWALSFFCQLSSIKSLPVP